MIESAKKSSITLCKKYNCKNMIQDFASDALEYVLEKCGDIEKILIIMMKLQAE